MGSPTHRMKFINSMPDTPTSTSNIVPRIIKMINLWLSDRQCLFSSTSKHYNLCFTGQYRHIIFAKNLCSYKAYSISILVFKFMSNIKHTRIFMMHMYVIQTKKNLINEIVTFKICYKQEISYLWAESSDSLPWTGVAWNLVLKS